MILLRRAIPIAACTLALAVGATPQALASGNPIASLCHCDPIVVGTPSGTQPGPGFVVILRDFSSNPLRNLPVELRCTGSGVRLYQQQEAGTTADCATDVLRRYTDMTGTAVFHARLGSFENASIIEVRGNGVLVGRIAARSTDLDGDGDTDVLDFARFRDNYLHRPDAPETDYDLDGATTIHDLHLFQEEFETRAAAAVCP